MNSFAEIALQEQKKKAEKYRYFLMRSLDETYPIDEEMEAKYGSEVTDYTSDTFGNLYAFKENFFKTIGEVPFGKSLKDYKAAAIDYLNASYPFCFNLSMEYEIDQVFPSQIKNRKYLLLYALSLGARSDQLDRVVDVLKSVSLNKGVPSTKVTRATGIEKQNVDLGSIVGSSVDKYRATNLLEAYEALNDKNMNGFIEYLLKSGVMQQKTSVMKGIALERDEQGNLFCAEGNHRVMAYMAIKAVKEAVTGKKCEPLMCDVSIKRIRAKEEPDYVFE